MLQFNMNTHKEQLWFNWIEKVGESGKLGAGSWKAGSGKWKE